MKKPIRLLTMIMVLLLAFTGTAVAEINYDDYSVEELIALKTQITEEITARTKSAKSVSVPAGKYIIGVDIPAGTYTLTFKGNYSTVISIYSWNGDILDYYLFMVGGSDTVGKIELQEGQQIEIATEPIIFSPYKGLGF